MNVYIDSVRFVIFSSYHSRGVLTNADMSSRDGNAEANNSSGAKVGNNSANSVQRDAAGAGSVELQAYDADDAVHGKLGQRASISSSLESFNLIADDGKGKRAGNNVSAGPNADATPRKRPDDLPLDVADCRRHRDDDTIR